MEYEIFILIVLIVVTFLMINFLKKRYEFIPKKFKELQNQIIPLRLNIYKDLDKTFSQIHSQKKEYNKKHIVLIMLILGTILFIKNFFNNYSILVDKIIFALVFALSFFIYILSIYYDIKVLKKYQLLNKEITLEIKKNIFIKNITYLIYLVIIIPLLLNIIISKI